MRVDESGLIGGVATAVVAMSLVSMKKPPANRKAIQARNAEAVLDDQALHPTSSGQHTIGNTQSAITAFREMVVVRHHEQRFVAFPRQVEQQIDDCATG